MSGTGQAIRFLTWNIHRGAGPDGRRDLARIVALIRRHEPDVVALQEVDSRPEWGTRGAFSRLKDELGTYSIAARTIRAPQGAYGHLVVSRWPLVGTTLHDISVGRHEPRLLIETTVAAPDGRLHVLAAHLGLFPQERRHQGIILADRAARAADPVIVAGDFNDWRRLGPATLALARQLPGRTEHRTFPSRWPLGRLDRIYCRPAAAILRSWTDPQARFASDHLPIVAEIGLDP